MNKKLKKLMKNDYVFSLIQKSLNIITGVITVALINRYLGTFLKGKYEYILNIVNISYIVLGFGFNASYPYMKRKNMPDQLHKYLNIFTLQFIVYMIFSIIISIITKNVIVCLTSTMIALRVFNNQLQSIGIVEFIRYRQILQIISYLVDMLLTLFVYLFIPQNLNALFIILIIKYLIYIILYLVKCKYIPKILNIDLKFLKFLFTFGFFAMLTSLLSEFNYSIDILVMKLFLPYSEIGLYSVGSKLAQYIWLIPDAFKDVLYSRTAKNDSVDEIKVIMRLNLFITLMLILMILIFGKIIIYILYGKEYLDAYFVTIIVFLGIPSMVIYKLLTPLYNANGKQKKCFIILLISVITNVCLNFVMIPLYGKTGAAVSTVISYTICGMILFIDFIKMYKLQWKDFIFIKKSDISFVTKKLKKQFLRRI
jgi:O-antigen/teichoic acid export membrane protein